MLIISFLILGTVHLKTLQTREDKVVLSEELLNTAVNVVNTMLLGVLDSQKNYDNERLADDDRGAG